MRPRTGREQKLHSVGSYSDRRTHEYVSEFGAIISSSVGTVQTLNHRTFDDAGRVTSVQRRGDDNSRSYEYYAYDDLGHRRRIGKVLKRPKVWIGLDFEEADFGKRKVRQLKGGQISIGHYGLPVPLRSGKATRQQAKLAAAESSTKVHRDDRI